jgi:protein-tyrosine kinase
MSRLAEALRRARQVEKLPDPPPDSSQSALDVFAPGDRAHTADAGAQIATDVPAADAALHAFVAESAGEEARTAGSGRGEHADDGQAAIAIPDARRPQPTTAPTFNPVMSGKVVGEDVKTITVEEYRRLAATLHQAQTDSGINVVMVASALAGEGKTLTSVNLSLTLSRSYGRRVLLIDADCRRPALHDIFDVPNVPGLNDALKADTDRKLTIIEITPTLSLLPAGRPDPDPISGLTSGRMRRIIEEAASRFEWVVIDTPPIGLITDAHLLAAMVHATVLVIQAGRTPCAAVQRAIQTIGRNRVIGVVLNRVSERTTMSGKYGDYYSSYRYSSRDGAKPATDAGENAGAPR